MNAQNGVWDMSYFKQKGASPTVGVQTAAGKQGKCKKLPFSDLFRLLINFSRTALFPHSSATIRNTQQMDRINHYTQGKRTLTPVTPLIILLIGLVVKGSDVSAFSLSPMHPEFCFCGPVQPSGKTQTTRFSRATSSLGYRDRTSGDTNGKAQLNSQQKWNLQASLMMMQKTSDSTKGAKPLQQHGASSSPVNNNEQDTAQKVDEYLEFLGKRYNRVHRFDRAHPKKTPFSVLAWLAQPQDENQNSNDDSGDDSQVKESNALYALGVAGLASERLLQKHGVTLKRCTIVDLDSSTSGKTIEVEHSSCESPKLQERMPLLLPSVLAAVVGRIVALRQFWETMQKTSMLSLLRKWHPWTRLSPSTWPPKLANLSRTLLKAGGGERNIQIALSVMCIFAVYFAQPLARLAVSSRTQV
jgi:hypothetical protein